MIGSGNVKFQSEKEFLEATSKATDVSNSLNRIFKGLKQEDIDIIWEKNFTFREVIDQSLLDLFEYNTITVNIDKEQFPKQVSILQILLNCGCIKEERGYDNKFIYIYDNRYSDLFTALRGILSLPEDSEEKLELLLKALEGIDGRHTPFSENKGQANTLIGLNNVTSYRYLEKLAKILNVSNTELLAVYSPLLVASVLFVNNVNFENLGFTDRGFLSLLQSNNWMIPEGFEVNLKEAFRNIESLYQREFSKLDSSLSTGIAVRDTDANRSYILLKVRVLTKILRVALSDRGYENTNNKALLELINFSMKIAPELSKYANSDQIDFDKRVTTELSELVTPKKPIGTRIAPEKRGNEGTNDSDIMSTDELREFASNAA